MLYPPVADLLKKVDSRYLLVNLVAHRARQIAAEAEAFQEDLPEKPVTMADATYLVVGEPFDVGFEESIFHILKFGFADNSLDFFHTLLRFE